MFSFSCPAFFQVVLIRWIVLVYDLIDDKDLLHSVYPVFFHFLQYEALVRLSRCGIVEL